MFAVSVASFLGGLTASVEVVRVVAIGDLVLVGGKGQGDWG